MPAYDAILVVAFGGPEGPDDVMPFLENVLRGRNVPRERMLEVAEHYLQFGGVSPINAQVRELLAVLQPELERQGVNLPVYWGNRNWHPLLTEIVPQMERDGVRRALAVVLSSYSSYSGCRQYRENIADALKCCSPAEKSVPENVARENALSGPQIDKMRVWYNHPDFITANADRLREAVQQLPPETQTNYEVAFTAHSIPSSMAANCDYEGQLRETCRLVAESVGLSADRWNLVYQSRSGRPTDPWLEPDINDHLRSRADAGVAAVVVAPVGFLSDHMEVLFDLDHEAADTAQELGMRMVRAGTVGTHPRFVSMLAELIRERMSENAERRAIGRFGPNHDVCPAGCCPAPRRPEARSAGQPQPS